MYFVRDFVVYFLFAFSRTNAVSIGAVRFYRYGQGDTTQRYRSGIVQIYYSFQWGNICLDSSFGQDEADVLCHQFGYTGSSVYTSTGFSPAYGVDLSSTLLDDVSCSDPSYLTITQCSFSTFISSDCTNQDDVIVTCYTTRIWENYGAGDIRLTGGTYSNEGLLEVYCNGEWGTVCDDFFDSTGATVACKQLGYNDYATFNHLDLKGSSKIWLRLYGFSTCFSTDSCLTDCDSCSTSDLTVCNHEEDVTLECAYDLSSNKVTTTTHGICSGQGEIASLEGTVRFYRNGVPDTSQSWSSGIVQIYYSGQWGNICDDFSFSRDESDVICHQLGYSGASSYSNPWISSEYGFDNAVSVLNSVMCNSSSYLAITQCLFDTLAFCSDLYDVIVTCYSTRIWDSPSIGDIRLTAGNYSNQGLLEVYCNGEWGTVCDDNFGLTEAAIACKQLGYNQYSSYNRLSSLQGSSNQKIWLQSRSSCSSSDLCLTACGGCPQGGSGVSVCSHSEDVTLECEYSSSNDAVSSQEHDTCIIHEDGTYSSAAIGGVIAGSVIGFICYLLFIIIPVCVCGCVGAGVCGGSRSTRPPRSMVVTQTVPSTATTATYEKITQEEERTTEFQSGAPPPYPAADYSIPPSQYDLPPAATQQNYPQQAYSGYRPQGYPPPQEGHPPGYSAHTQPSAQPQQPINPSFYAPPPY